MPYNPTVYTDGVLNDVTAAKLNKGENAIQSVTALAEDTQADVATLMAAPTVPTLASAATVTVTTDRVIKISGATTITALAGGTTGQLVTLVFLGALTLVDGAGLRLAGNFVTAADSSITLVCADGTIWVEACRSSNGAAASSSSLTETWESNGFTVGSWSTPVIVGTGSVTTDPAAARSGSYGLKLSKPTNDTAAYVRKTFPATNSVHVEGWYRYDSDSGNTASNGTGPRLFAGSNRIVDVARQDGTDKRIFLRYQSTDLVPANALFIQTGVTVELDTWVKIALRVDWASGANTRIRVWVNDVLRIDQSTLTVYAGGYTALQLGSEHTAQFVDLHVDDLFLDWAPAVEVPNPNLVTSFGGKLRNTADNTLFHGPGLNVHTHGFSFSQTTFTNWAAEGVKLVRLMFWPKNIETAPGTFDQTQLNHIHTSIQRAGAAGIRVLLCPLINTPVWSDAPNRLPAHWINGGGNGPATPVGEWNTASMFDCICSHGEGYLKKVMTEFRSYTHVIGVEFCNEPDRSSAGPIQRGTERMLAWVRAEDANTQKLWFVATNMYSSQDAANGDNVWTAITDWTRVVLQMHSYFAPQSAADDGWAGAVGMRDSGAGTYLNGSPEATTYSTANKASFALHFAGWAAEATARGVPWGIGEAGFQHAKATSGVRLAWCEDIRDAARTAGASYLLGWIGADTLAQDAWSSSNNQVMRAEYLAMMGFTSV